MCFSGLVYVGITTVCDGSPFVFGSGSDSTREESGFSLYIRLGDEMGEWVQGSALTSSEVFLDKDLIVVWGLVCSGPAGRWQQG